MNIDVANQSIWNLETTWHSLDVPFPFPFPARSARNVACADYTTKLTFVMLVACTQLSLLATSIMFRAKLLGALKSKKQETTEIPRSLIIAKSRVPCVRWIDFKARGSFRALILERGFSYEITLCVFEVFWTIFWKFWKKVARNHIFRLK